MKIKTVVSVVLAGGIMVACGGGGGGGSSYYPAAPTSTELQSDPFGDKTKNDLPYGSDTNGAKFDESFKEMAMPGTGGYEKIALDENTTKMLEDSQQTSPKQAIGVTQVGGAGGAGGSGGGGCYSSGLLTAVSSSSVVSMINTQSKAVSIKKPCTAASLSNISQLKDVSDSDYLFESYTLNTPPTSNIVMIRTNKFFLESVNAMVYANSTNIYVVSPTDLGSELSIPVSATGCTGEIKTVSTYASGGKNYLAIGTGAANKAGTVCVATIGNTGFESWTNLSAQAPTTGTNAYAGGPVKGFGFPSQSGSSLVGYWFAGTKIYKVLGINGNTPTGSGFLNTTTGAQQITQSGATRVTFTGFPQAPDHIHSVYTDPAGNVWVGTVTGKVYVLRPNNGNAIWTQMTLSAAATSSDKVVNVSYDGSNSGAIATLESNVYNVE